MSQPERVAPPLGGYSEMVAKTESVPMIKIPPTPLYERGALHGAIKPANKSSSPFAKGGPRGIFLSIRLPENHHSIFTLQAKLNYTTSIAGGF